MSDIIEFLSDRLAVQFDGFSKPLKFKQFLRDKQFSASRIDLEGCHNYIQWLFPLPERSKFNLNAPILTADDLTLICNSFYIKYNIYTAFQRMIIFYGFRCADKYGSKIKPPLIKLDNYLLCWLTKNNHNLLRITRILRCLTLCGLRDVSDNFLQALEELKKVYPEVITELIWNHWFAANQGNLYVS